MAININLTAMTMKYPKIYLLLIVSVLLLSSCTDSESELYEGQNYVTFDLTDSEVFDLPEGIAIPVDVNIALPRDEDTKVYFQLEEFNAVEGKDYILTTKEVIIPKGKQVGQMILQAIDDNEENFLERSVTVRIIDVSAPSDLVIGYENGTVYSSLRINIKDDDCPIALSERYRGEVYSSTFGSVGGENHIFPSRLEEIGDEVYRFSNIWGDYVAYLTENPAFTGGFPVTMDFTFDELGNVVILEASMVGADDVEILIDKMEAIYDPCEDSFNIHMVQKGLFSEDEYDIYTRFTP
ncbi:hypothetical protein [Persicobacter psychrovividus]|uniref:Calx-beta domain-containing protein n=1 Tax=Persicobacter psychrovividus TaxID=387638 RepID=A0ABM7VBI3_9BACT|nr:hypothetical protein PEPS_05500 [Persicobacter psychrovividus]